MLVEIKTVNKQEVTVVTSLDVAETFEKRHDHVLRDIEELKKDVPNFGEMFYETEYLASNGKKSFEKEHKRPLHYIRDMKCSKEFREHNFAQSEYMIEACLSGVLNAIFNLLKS